MLDMDDNPSICRRQMVTQGFSRNLICHCAIGFAGVETCESKESFATQDSILSSIRGSLNFPWGGIDESRATNGMRAAVGASNLTCQYLSGPSVTELQLDAFWHHGAYNNAEIRLRIPAELTCMPPLDPILDRPTRTKLFFDGLVTIRPSEDAMAPLLVQVHVVGAVDDIQLGGGEGSVSMTDIVYEREPELFNKRSVFRGSVGQAERQRIYYSEGRRRWQIGVDFNDEGVLAFNEQDAELPTMVTLPWVVRNASGIGFTQKPTFKVLPVIEPPPLAPFTVMMVSSAFQVPQAFPSSRTPVLLAEPNRTQEVDIDASNLLLPREVAGNPNIYHKITYDLVMLNSPEDNAAGCVGVASVAAVDGRAFIRILATSVVERCDYLLLAAEKETGEVRVADILFFFFSPALKKKCTPPRKWTDADKNV